MERPLTLGYPDAGMTKPPPDIGTRRTAAQTREHVLAVAQELFYWHGIRATGVDKIAAEAGIAPTTLYRAFASKADLVAAYVERNAEGYKNWVTSVTSPDLGDPRQRILLLFDALTEQVQPERCRGCPFLMTLAEFPDPTVAARVHAIAVKSWIRDRLHELTNDLSILTPIADPDGLADQLALVMEGVYASVQALGAEGPAQQARAVAETLIDAAAGTDPAAR
jgi:AcrR family transcriptional regulator